ncbi:MAG TPA: c-type cytochrome [Oculatellaceae cyanobacterium]|jgi:mono/diheme cytochrome c family protein
MRVWAGFLAVTALFLLAGCSQPGQAPGAATSTASSPGQSLFLSHCVACHMGPGDPPGPDAVIRHSRSLASEAAFAEFLRHPTSAAMPAFDEKTLNEQQVTELYAYLLSQRK